MRPNLNSPENWARMSSDAKRFLLQATFPLGLANSLVVVLFDGERADRQSKLVSLASSDPNASLSLPTASSHAEQTKSTDSPLFRAFRSVSAEVRPSSTFGARPEL